MDFHAVGTNIYGENCLKSVRAKREKEAFGSLGKNGAATARVHVSKNNSNLRTRGSVCCYVSSKPIQKPSSAGDGGPICRTTHALNSGLNLVALTGIEPVFRP
jgi:hypothetical protein